VPLIKSKSPQAFSKNVATEVAAGKPQDQAVAIAYSEKRAAGRGDKARAMKMDKMDGMDSMHGGSPHMIEHGARRMKEIKGY
jgi:hypothetical protein